MQFGIDLKLSFKFSWITVRSWME